MKNEIHAYFRDQNVILTHCLFRCKGNASKEDKFRIIYIQMELENLEFDFIQMKIGKKTKAHTLDKQSVSLCKHWSSPGYAKSRRGSGVAENESGEHISSLTRNLSGGRGGGGGTGLDRTVCSGLGLENSAASVLVVVLEASSGESFRHLKNFHGFCGGCWWW